MPHRPPHGDPTAPQANGEVQAADAMAGPPVDTPAPLERLAAVLPMAAVTALTLGWAVSPSVPVQVRGAAVLLEPDSRVSVYARSPGQIQRLAAATGAVVRRGQVLASIDRVDQAAPGGGWVASNPNALQRQATAIDRQQAALRQQIASVSTTNKPVGQQLAALEALRREEVIPRYSPLWVSAQGLYLQNNSQIRALEAQIAQLEASRAELQASRSSQLVTSPRDGELLSWQVAEGQSVIPGQALAIVGPPPRPVAGHRTAIALFTEADATRLRPGQEIQVEPQLMSRQLYGGTSQRYGAVIGRIRRLSPISLDAAALTRVVGDADLASSLAIRSRQEAFGEGGDPGEVLGQKLSSPVVLAVVDLEPAATPTGLRWSAGTGPSLVLENGTPAAAKVEVERRPPLGFLLPFLRWLGGQER